MHPAAGFGTQTRCIFEIISRKENCQFGPAFSILVDYEPPNQAGRTIYKAADNPGALQQGLADVLAEAPQFSVQKFK